MRRVPWLFLGLVATAGALLMGAWVARTFALSLPPCPLKARLGIPCATCGITRCVLALSAGRWAEALHWHPVAVVLMGLSPLAMAWDLRRAWRGDPYPALPDSLAVRLCAATLFLGTWVLQIVRGI